MQIRKTVGSDKPELSLTESATDGGSVLSVGSGDNSNVITLTIFSLARLLREMGKESQKK